MYTKHDIIKHTKKYVYDKELKNNLLNAVEKDLNSGHTARILTENLCIMHPKSTRLQELDAMIMEYYNFG